MDLEAQVVKAIEEELQRQAEEAGLHIGAKRPGSLDIAGTINLEALAMAVVGAVAGGP
jgi:hypothetical protein